MWDEVIGHEDNKKFLQRLLQGSQHPHALLFYGADGIGKKFLAQHFVRSLLCVCSGRGYRTLRQSANPAGS
jgi:DNA polymerase-3 subunit delta'